MSENWMGTGAGNPGVMGAGSVREAGEERAGGGIAKGGRNPGVMGTGSVREAGEERAGDGIPKGVAWEKGDIYRK